MSDIEAGIVRQAKLAGEPIPEHISNAPRLQSRDQFFYTAFLDCDSERSHGMGLTRMPRSAIIEYAKECGLNEEEKYELVYILRMIDDAHLANLAKKHAKPS